MSHRLGRSHSGGFYPTGGERNPVRCKCFTSGCGATHNGWGYPIVKRTFNRCGTTISAGRVRAGKAHAEGLAQEVEKLQAELAGVTAERDDYRDTVDEFIKDHKVWQDRALTPEKRDRILNALGVGKQSPQYKRVKTELDKLL